MEEKVFCNEEAGCCEAVPNSVLKKKAFWGEFIGTYLMCFFGIGAVATATLFGAHTGAFQVGMVWGITIAIAIYLTRNLSCAHFNPAVTIAMCVAKRSSWKILPLYFISQLLGAMAAACTLWIFFKDSVMNFLANNNLTMDIVSGVSGIWCENFPNAAGGVISPFVGFFAEALGVFILVIVIFSLTEGCNIGRPSDDIFPLFIGLTITMLISVIGPMTDAGLNPARALGPRVIGWLVGFKTMAFSWDVVFVYVLGPIVGAVLASLFFTKVLEPAQASSKTHI